MQHHYSLGDGIVALALAAAFLGYLYLKHREKQRLVEIVHSERLAALEKGVPLPELPLEPLFVRTERPPDDRTGLLIGVVLLCFGVGSSLSLLLVPGGAPYWAAPLPIAFIGGGLVYAFSVGLRVERGL